MQLSNSSSYCTSHCTTASCNKTNIFRVSHILEFISPAFMPVQKQQNKKNEENIYIAQGCRAITILSVAQK